MWTPFTLHPVQYKQTHRGVWAYIDLATSTIKKKKVLRSILSCFPFEARELWKLKTTTLRLFFALFWVFFFVVVVLFCFVFLLVGSFLCYLFAIMFFENLTSL